MKYYGCPSSSGSSTSTLQDVYNNSSPPEILTDSIKGALDIRRGSAADSDSVLTVQNNTGTVTFAVTGTGAVTGLSFNGAVLSSAGNVSQYLNGTGNYTNLVSLTNSLYYGDFL